MIIFKPRALCPAGYTSNPEKASLTESLLYLGKDKTASDGLCVIAAKHIQAILFDSCFFVSSIKKSLGHCYQIGRLLLTVCLPKSHTVSCDVFCPMTTRVINQWVISPLFLVLNITIVELSKQLLLSCNIRLCGLFSVLFFFLRREWKRSSLADQMFSQLRFIKNYFTFPFVRSWGFKHLKHFQAIVYFVSNKTLATIKFTILGNLNISLKVIVSVIIGTMFI